MGAREYEALVAGETLNNVTDHSLEGKRTDSVGFCWTPVPPFKSIHWLSGSVDTDYCVCAVFPTRKMKATRGLYPQGWKQEYCCTRYSLEDIELVYASRDWRHIPNRQQTEALLRSFGLVPSKPKPNND